MNKIQILEKRIKIQKKLMHLIFKKSRDTKDPDLIVASQILDQLICQYYTTLYPDIKLPHLYPKTQQGPILKLIHPKTHQNPIKDPTEHKRTKNNSKDP